MAKDKRDKLKIRLTVYGKEFSVNTPREDEEYYRKAALLVTDLVNFYAERFNKHKEKDEIFLMTLIDVAFRFAKTAANTDTEPYKEVINMLSKEIEACLHETSDE